MRRAIPLLALLVVVLVAARACSGGSAAPNRAGLHARTPSPTPAASATVAPYCKAGQLSVEAATDASSYPSGVEPRLSGTVRNTSAAPCRLSPAAATFHWVIWSGNDRLWTYPNCASSTSTRLRLAGHAESRHRMLWDRHRGTVCESPGSLAQPGTYRLYVTVYGVTSPAAIFHLTG
jgi:hypothetical protein